MSIAVTIESDALAEKLAALPDALRSRLGAGLGTIAAALYARVLDNLSGAVVQSRSGALKAAITVAADNGAVAVGVDSGAAPYAAALEFGASIPAQLIAAKNAKALAFVLPPHSFLRAALADLAPDAIATLQDAVSVAIES